MVKLNEIVNSWGKKMNQDGIKQKRSKSPSLEFIPDNKILKSSIKRNVSENIIEEGNIVRSNEKGDHQGIHSEFMHFWVNKIERDIKERRNSLPSCLPQLNYDLNHEQQKVKEKKSSDLEY